MTVEYSSVTCQEEQYSVRETVDMFNGFQATVTLRCAWTDRYALILDLLGTPRAWPKVTTGLTPYAINAVARPDLMTDVGTNTAQQCGYKDALVDVTYNTQIIDVAAESIEPTMEAVPLDYKLFCWSTGASRTLLTEGEAPPFIQRSLNLVRTRFKLAAIPTDVLAAVGCVNNAAYTSSLLGLTFAAETLLFLPAPLNRSWTNFTASGFTCTLKFGYKPYGWNTYWRAETAAYEHIHFAGSSSNYIGYPLYNFSALFA